MLGRLAILAAVIVALALAGCGQSSGTAEPSTTESTSASQEASEARAAKRAKLKGEIAALEKKIHSQEPAARRAIEEAIAEPPPSATVEVESETLTRR